MPRRPAPTSRTTSTTYSMPYKFGIEIECFGSSKETLEEAIRNTTGINQWQVKFDGSVSGNGLEVISPPLKANTAGFKQVTKICKILRDNGMNVDRTCGLHVHLSRTGGWSVGQATTIFRRYGFFERQIDEFMSQSRRRSVNQYCQSISDNNRLTQSNVGRYFNFVTVRDNEYQSNYDDQYLRRDATTALLRATNYDRYYKVNLQSLNEHGTIEFRQHSGTIDKDKIINWTKFLIEFCQKSIDILGSFTPEQVPEESPAFPERNLALRLIRPTDGRLNSTQKIILKSLYENRNGITITGIQNYIRQSEQHIGRPPVRETIISYISTIKREIEINAWGEYTSFHIRRENRKYKLTYENDRTRRQLSNQNNIHWVNFNNDNLFDGVNAPTVEFLNQRRIALSGGTDTESVEPTQPTRRQQREQSRAVARAGEGPGVGGCNCDSCIAIARERRRRA